MKIHTDTLTAGDLWTTSPPGTCVELTTHGSRKRDHAFNVRMGAIPGSDAHGIKRCYAQNSGTYGAACGSDYRKAATWVEWGDWIVALFLLDPSAIIGYYDGPDDFIAQTQRYAPHRPKREDAMFYANRWRERLIPVAPTDAWTEL